MEMFTARLAFWSLGPDNVNPCDSIQLLVFTPSENSTGELITRPASPLPHLAFGRPRGMGWGGKWEGSSGWGTHVNPWLIHVNVQQKPLQYCKVISLQLIKINGKKMLCQNLSRSSGILEMSHQSRV